MSDPWWRDAVFYQVYPRSFADSDGDGIGDLEGIRRRLDHLVDLGIDAVWLSPIYQSPQADFGYDISDHCAIDPIFGTLVDFDRLVRDVHDRGLRLILDWVPNHVSDAHPWFIDARSGTDAAHRDWFVWRPATGTPGEPPNNWTAAFSPGASAWSLDVDSDQWFLHLFLPAQPDLDWENPAVESAMHDVLRFWLDRGVDGFRADAIHTIAKPAGLPSVPEDVAEIPTCVLNDVPAIHERLRRIRGVLDEFGPDRMMIGEVYLLDSARVATYYGTPDAPELHLAFNVPVVHTPWNAGMFALRLDEIDAHFTPRDAWPVWALSSHDEARHRTRFDRADGADETRSERRVRAAATLTLTQRGTPFLYQGEELGLADVDVPAGQRLDPGGRDGCRAPIPWDETAGHGWPAGDVEPWLPLGLQAATRNAERERRDPNSTLAFYRRLLALRRSTPALLRGDIKRLPAARGLLAWRRTAPALEGSGGDSAGDRIVVVNFTPEPLAMPDAADGWTVDLASDDGLSGSPIAGQPVPATVAGDQAIICRPTFV